MAPLAEPEFSAKFAPRLSLVFLGCEGRNDEENGRSIGRHHHGSVFEIMIVDNENFAIDGTDIKKFSQPSSKFRSLSPISVAGRTPFVISFEEHSKREIFNPFLNIRQETTDSPRYD